MRGLVVSRHLQQTLMHVHQQMQSVAVAKDDRIHERWLSGSSERPKTNARVTKNDISVPANAQM